MPIQWNLTKVLSKCQPVELLLPMFIQNLNSDQHDKSNEDLYKEIIEKIEKQHDRHITLLGTDQLLRDCEILFLYDLKSGKL